MGRDNYFFVFIVLCLLNIINAKEQEVYDYKANIITSNKASAEGFSKWTISGTLTVQNLDSNKIFKLDDLKTLVFNGERSAKEPELKKPLEDVEYITTPFEAYYNNLENKVEISIGEKEPEWSANMKKAIASIFNIDKTTKDGTKNIEQTIYGNCKVNYERDPQKDEEVIKKIINRNSCTDFPNTEWQNVDDIDLKNNHTINQIENERYYTFDKLGKLKYVEATSNFTYQNMPAVRATHHVEQRVEFKMLSTTEDFTPLNIPEGSKKVSIIMEFSVEEKESEQTEVIDKFAAALGNFTKEFKKRPIENADIRDIDRVDQMWNALSELNREGMSSLISHPIFNDEEPETILLLISLLPYIGTDATADFILKMVKEDKANDLIMIRLLATFPIYVNAPSQKMLEEFELFVNLKHVGNSQVKYAGLMSYAALVSETFERGDVEEKYLVKIFNEYYTSLKTSENYEEKMSYLLGIINLAKTLKEELMLQIITDHDLEANLRALATFGFKKYLTNSAEENIFAQLWPVVQNTSENFDVRISALDLLLSANITEKDFNTIVNTFEKKPETPTEEHIANYVFTTLQSLENSTGYSDYLSDFATARLQKDTIHRSTNTWTTGNYRLAFSDDDANFGASFQARLIGTPISNGLDTIHLSFDHFEMSLKLDSYTLYIKLGGVYEKVYEAFVNSRNSSESSASALLDLIKKCGCELKKGEDIHVDIALFTEGRAVVGLHLDKDNIDSYSENPLFLDMLKLLVFYQPISFPLIKFYSIPSEAGTAIQVTERIHDIIYHEFENIEVFFGDDELKDVVYHFKSVSSYDSTVQCDNPLAKVEALVYKHRKDQKAFDFPFKLNTTDMVISWRLKNDTFKWVSDSFLGTSYNEDEEEDNFKHYCPDCDEYFEIPRGNHNESVFELQEFGLTIYGSRTNNSEEQKQLNNMEPVRGPVPFIVMQYNHRSNGHAFPPAKPLMYLLHLNYYMKTVNELDSFYFGISPAYLGLKYESVLDLFINVDSITKNNDPLDEAGLEFSFNFHNQKLDGEVLSGINSTFKSAMTTKSSSVDDQSKTHVEQSTALYIDFFNNYNEGSYHKICINSETLYPSKRSDKLSIKPIKPARGKITVAWGEVPSLSQCPEKLIKFTEVYTATESQNRKVEESTEYKKCKEDSEGSKYVPPTEACIKAHNALSKYDVYGLYADFKQAGNIKYLEETMEKTKLGYKVLEYKHIDEGHLNISISHSFAEILFGISNPDLLDYEENSAFYDFVRVDPTALAYDDYDIAAGISSTCIISPNSLKSFTGNHGQVFKDTQEEVAFVDCSDPPKAGMTVQKLNNKAVGFKFWSGANILQANMENGKLTIILNGEKINSNPEKQNDDLKIYFLEDDVIYVVGSTVEIYYTTEYISIKTFAVYNKLICGKCSYTGK